MIELLNINFAHSPSDDSTATALHVRKNASVDALIPEWQTGVTHTAEESVAAYAISEVGQRRITIRASLRSTNPQIRMAFVRAIDGAPHDERRGCLAVFRWFLGSPADLEAINVNILGEVQEREVTFGPSGDSEPLEFTLSRTRFDLGVLAGTTTWRWQYRLSPTESWSDIGAPSVHTIYAILSPPTAPWVITPGTDERSRHSVLWTDVLDHTCWWARSQRTPEAAAGAITEQLFARGELGFLTYETHSGMAQLLGPGGFQLQRLLNVLSTRPAHSPQQVNCDDCACALVTFANALGCDLWVKVLGRREQFYVNAVRAIGLAEWNRLIHSQIDAGGYWFDYHTVAMTGEATFEDNVFDSTLQLNANTDPASAPFRPALAKNLLFGNVGSTGTYRHRLARRDTHSQVNCSPSERERFRPIIWSLP